MSHLSIDDLLAPAHPYPRPDKSGNGPLRIAFVVSSFHPFASGAERQALAQGVELVRRGHSVRVITKSVPGYPIDDEQYRGLSIHRWVRTIERGPVFALSFISGVVVALRRLRSAIDVVHTHQGLWEAVATGLARPWLEGIPTLVQPASSGFYGEADELGRTRGRSILRKVILSNTGFAAISADIERQWRELGVRSSRMVRTSSGVDAVQFCPGPSAVESSLLPRPRVMFTGRLHPQKNIPLLLEAWTEVARRTSANLILVGPGTDRQPLEELATRLGIADRVQFTGPVPDPSDHLRAADIFVLPSLAEGMSNSLLEAMATALPCIVSGIGGNTDLITDQLTGRLVSEPSSRDWATAVIDLIKHPENAREFGLKARERIDREYSLEAVVERNLGLYRKMIANEWPERFNP